MLKVVLRVNKTFSDDFLAHTGLLCLSVLSSLLFIIILEVLDRENRPGSSEEMLYANDVVLVSKALEVLKGRQDA